MSFMVMSLKLIRSYSTAQAFTISSFLALVNIDTVSKYFTGGNFYEESYIIHNSSHNLVSVDFRDIFNAEELSTALLKAITGR